MHIPALREIGDNPDEWISHAVHAHTRRPDDRDGEEWLEDAEHLGDRIAEPQFVVLAAADGRRDKRDRLGTPLISSQRVVKCLPQFHPPRMPLRHPEILSNSAMVSAEKPAMAGIDAKAEKEADLVMGVSCQ